MAHGLLILSACENPVNSNSNTVNSFQASLPTKKPHPADPTQLKNSSISRNQGFSAAFPIVTTAACFKDEYGRPG